MPKAEYYRNALRLLFILVRGCEPYSDEDLPNEVGVFDGEVKLQALDFWIRYPDYLADELLSNYEATGTKRYLDTARRIFDEEEPDLRRVPMLRNYFGAYEPVDTAIAHLKARGLVTPRTKPLGKAANHRDFLVSSAAFDLVERIVAEQPEFYWYESRVGLVLEMADGRGGKALKDRQHAQKEYHETRRGDLIPTIAERVRKRLADALEAANG
ncbi:hypothetical protein IVB02_19005 [Bradyrhizobium sp. 166]|uniref:hypothetical protein n=1 Tax=Bradyrhizobium sp. 166 TaxID=2782638 RepID=UPI001FF8BE82|nr:hypothetical protein [Bradyrhizobium sp. 166]MCK1603473.1 hypothetical protein [Bradyrhizobium sp. 166]